METLIVVVLVALALASLALLCVVQRNLKKTATRLEALEERLDRVESVSRPIVAEKASYANPPPSISSKSRRAGKTKL